MSDTSTKGERAFVLLCASAVATAGFLWPGAAKWILGFLCFVIVLFESMGD